MYRVLCDGLPIYDLRDENLVLLDPKATLEVNTAGSFTFKMPPDHPQYDSIVKMRSCIQIYHDDEEIFAGRPISDTSDFYNRKNVTCEGQLAYLNDSVQRPAEYHDMTVRGYLETLINIHNQQVDESRQFEVGIVTVTDNNDSLYRYTNWENTLTAIKEDLVDDLGGYIRVRNYNGHRYIDYIAEFDNVCTQSIEFGENLLDFSKNTDLTDIATAIIPLGARLEESEIAALEQRLTIESVNNGVDYLVNAEAVAKYGFIVKTVTWDDVTTPEMLKSKGQRWLADEQFESMVIDVKAVDLHYTDEQIEQFKLFDMIPVHSTPHGLNRNFPLSKMTVNLANPSANTFELGTTVNTSLSAKTNAIQSTLKTVTETIPVPSAIVQQAVDQATALITAATHGHVVTTAEEQLIMDTADVNTAKKVWRWNLNGLGYSSTGYNGTYATAITMDGQIVGQRIVANSISGDKLDITYKNSVTKEIADAEANATDAAEDYTDGQLKSYYTKSEIETSIKTLEDSVLLSAKETATQYVDNKLKSYSTSAEIKVTTDGITQEVNKKLNSSELSTKIQQSASAVKIAWNSISKYIQFESGEIRIYENTTQSDDALLCRLTYSGNWYYYKGSTIGKIGTNGWAGDNTFRGLMFDLQYGADYMGWGYQETSGGNYIVQLIYYANDRKSKKGLHLSGKTYCWGNLYINDYIRTVNYTDGSAGFYSTEKPISVQGTKVTIRGGGSFVCDTNKFVFYNSASSTSDNLVDCYNNIDMHNYSIRNQSDARLKKNIEVPDLDCLDLLNKIELKSFDWIEEGTHESVGIIAQQLLPILPELVAEDSETGRLSIKENKFVPFLIAAVQQLTDLIQPGKYDRTAQWEDTFSMLEKKAFIEHSRKDRETEVAEVKQDPVILPNRKKG